jgi:hypothetical protein
MVLKNGTQRYNGGAGDRRLFKLKVFVASIPRHLKLIKGGVMILFGSMHYTFSSAPTPAMNNDNNNSSN